MRLWIMKNGKHDLTSEGPDFTRLVISLRLTFTSLSSCWCPVVLRDLFNSSATDSVCSHSSHYAKQCHTIFWLNVILICLFLDFSFFQRVGLVPGACPSLYMSTLSTTHCDRPTGQPVSGLSAQSVLGTVRNVQEAIVGLVSVIDLQGKVEKTMAHMVYTNTNTSAHSLWNQQTSIIIVITIFVFIIIGWGFEDSLWHRLYHTGCSFFYENSTYNHVVVTVLLHSIPPKTVVFPCITKFKMDLFHLVPINVVAWLTCPDLRTSSSGITSCRTPNLAQSSSTTEAWTFRTVYQHQADQPTMESAWYVPNPPTCPLRVLGHHLASLHRGGAAATAGEEIDDLPATQMKMHVLHNTTNINNDINDDVVVVGGGGGGLPS